MLSVKDFGALGDGTDQTAALQAAEDAASAAADTLYFPGGIYLVNSTGLKKKTKASWLGEPGAVIRAQAGAWTNDLVNNVYIGDFSIKGITFDGSGMTGRNSVLGLVVCNNIWIEGCEFLGWTTFALALVGATDFWVLNNKFMRASTSSAENEALLVSNDGGGSANGIVRGNRCINSGIEFNGQKIVIDGNVITGFGFGSGITVNPDATTSHFTITGNIVTGGVGLDGSGICPAGIENWAPHSTITGNICMNNAGDGISNGGQFCTVLGNVCLNNAQNPVQQRAGIVSAYGDATHNGSHSVISGNVCSDDQATPTQNWGYMEWGALTGISLRGNRFDGNKLAPMQLSGSATKFDFAGPQLWGAATDSSRNLSNGSSATGTVTVTGAAMGDLVRVSRDQSTKGVRFFGWVSAANVVSWRMENETGSSQSISAGTIRAAVEKPPSYAAY